MSFVYDENEEKKMEPYFVYRIGGRPVFSVPVSYPKVKRAGIRLYKAVSWRRWLFKKLLGLEMFGMIDKFLGSLCSSPVPIYPHFPFATFLRKIRQDMGISDLQPVVTFPTTLERSRFYVNLLSSSAKELGFAKVSVDTVNDSSLTREVETINKLSNSPICSFEFPKVMSEGTIGPYRYVIFEPLPNNARPIEAKWDGIAQTCRDELTAASCRVQKLEELSWWSSFQEIMPDVRPLADEINAWADRDATVCWAHGDYTRSNMCYAGGRVWVFDWEDSAPDAPIMTDEVRFFLEAHGRLLVTNPKRVGELLAHRFLGAFDAQANEIALALVSVCEKKWKRSHYGQTMAANQTGAQTQCQKAIEIGLLLTTKPTTMIMLFIVRVQLVIFFGVLKNLFLRRLSGR